VSVRLWTFQPLVRIAALERAGRMTGSWEWSRRGSRLRQGGATVEFDAPSELCLASDYGAWNDYPCPLAQRLVQVCLPELRAGWVREIRPLPDEITAEERSGPA